MATASKGSSSAAPRARRLRVALEVGPKHKKVVAFAPDWPGLERGAANEEAAIERLQTYCARYARVARLGGFGPEFAASSGIRVVERFPGTGSTDFWGISFAFARLDQRLTADALDRELALMRACWRYFDEVRRRVSAELQKGPKGGGRDRDRIVSHVLGVEQDWAKKLGIRAPDDEVVLDDKGLRTFRNAYCATIREFHADRRPARTWPLRYLVRHTAYHAMDHAWEMEDKDLSGSNR